MYHLINIYFIALQKQYHPICTYGVYHLSLWSERLIYHSASVASMHIPCWLALFNWSLMQPFRRSALMGAPPLKPVKIVGLVRSSLLEIPQRFFRLAAINYPALQPPQYYDCIFCSDILSCGVMKYLSLHKSYITITLF